jgi:hypothetical protein
VTFEPRQDATRRQGRSEWESRMKQPRLVGRRPYVPVKLGVAHAIACFRFGYAHDGVTHVDDGVSLAERPHSSVRERHESGRRIVTHVALLIPFPAHLGVEGRWLISGWKIAPARR